MYESIRKNSHGRRLFTCCMTDVSRYSVVVSSTTPAILSISSVVSSSMTSKMSSIVTIPTSLSSLSTTGMARKPYLWNISDTSSWSSYTLTLTKSVRIRSSIGVSSSLMTSVFSEMMPVSFLPKSLIYILRIFFRNFNKYFSKTIVNFTFLGKKFVHPLFTNLIIFLAKSTGIITFNLLFNEEEEEIFKLPENEGKKK